MKLTLDIGGSKTRGGLFGAGGGRSFVLSGSYGLATDSDVPNEALAAALGTALGADASRIFAVAVNLGGKNKTEIEATVRAVLPDARIFVSRESEGAIAARILACYGADVLVMAGTGCIAFARKDTHFAVVGGWGKEIGDEGSGYFIGMTAVQRALRELDGTEALSPFTKELFGVDAPFHFASADAYAAARDSVRAKIPKTRESIAALARTVTACAERGCALSLGVLRLCGEEMAALAYRAAKKLGIGTPRIVVNGGLVWFRQYWQDAFPENTVYITDGIDTVLKEIVEDMV